MLTDTYEVFSIRGHLDIGTRLLLAVESKSNVGGRCEYDCDSNYVHPDVVMWALESENTAYRLAESR